MYISDSGRGHVFTTEIASESYTYILRIISSFASNAVKGKTKCTDLRDKIVLRTAKKTDFGNHRYNGRYGRNGLYGQCPSFVMRFLGLRSRSYFAFALRA